MVRFMSVAHTENLKYCVSTTPPTASNQCVTAARTLITSARKERRNQRAWVGGACWNEHFLNCLNGGIHPIGVPLDIWNWEMNRLTIIMCHCQHQPSPHTPLILPRAPPQLEYKHLCQYLMVLNRQAASASRQPCGWEEPCCFIELVFLEGLLESSALSSSSIGDVIWRLRVFLVLLAICSRNSVMKSLSILRSSSCRKWRWHQRGESGAYNSHFRIMASGDLWIKKYSRADTPNWRRCWCRWR